MLPIDAKHKLFFAGYNGEIEQIGLAWSDDLEHWHVHDRPIIPLGDDKSFDAVQTSNPFVFQDGDQYIMIYQARSGDDRQLRFGRAVSEDLLNWRKDPDPYFAINIPDGVPGKRDGCQHPHIVKDGDQYHLFFTHQIGANTAIRTAISQDLKTWDVLEAPCLTQVKDHEAMFIYYPWVMKHKDQWLMWYSAVSGTRQKPRWVIGRALSDDGLSWTRTPEEETSIDFRPGFLRWDRAITGFANPCVRDLGNRFRMLTHAVLKSGEMVICMHDSEDKGISWRTVKTGVIRPARTKWCKKFDADPFLLSV